MKPLNNANQHEIATENSVFFCVVSWLVFLIFIQSTITTAQTPPQPVDLETILKKAEKETQNYREAFKNLLSEETKTFETFGKVGELKKRTVVESNFIVYQSAKNENIISEYRNIVKVDGKIVGDSDKRTVDLFAEIAKTGSIEAELRRIQKESLRYDKTLRINGMTLWQAIILSEHIRPFFEFKLLGRENLNGAELFLVEYRQTNPSPYISINEEAAEKNKPTISFSLNLPAGFNRSKVFLRGKLWIDAATFQIRRDENEVTVQNETSLAVALRSEFDYRESPLGILVPGKLSFSYFDISAKNGITSARLYAKATLEYAKFGTTKVEIRSNEVSVPKIQ